jgi:hypothetical protein
MNAECSQTVTESSQIYRKMPFAQKEKYYRILVFNEANRHPNRRLCPKDGCLGFMLIDQIPVQCIICGQEYCTSCLFARHDGPCD